MSLCRITFVNTGREAYMLHIESTNEVFLLNERTQRFVKCKQISKPFHTSRINHL